ncbi:hypothetical protein VP01_2858g3 [Puccinia sorghi]|uniref:Uncharacterized protein n=1 Tax=Puccinia sorghi TaxID=27349 RepID=A0A0L6V1Y2_9BASI|nr:hypothetical protein VP01_2858g3 [Puccinia sorghi]
MTQQGKSQEEIQKSLGQPISHQSFNQWITLYNETKPDPFNRGLIIYGPALHRQTHPFFLEKVRERLYNHIRTLLSMEVVDENLVNHLEITLKKADTVNSYKCLPSSLFLQLIFIILHNGTNESSVCNKDLLQTFACTSHGAPATQTVEFSLEKAH